MPSRFYYFSVFLLTTNSTQTSLLNINWIRFSFSENDCGEIQSILFGYVSPQRAETCVYMFEFSDSAGLDWSSIRFSIEQNQQKKKTKIIKKKEKHYIPLSPFSNLAFIVISLWLLACGNDNFLLVVCSAENKRNIVCVCMYYKRIDCTQWRHINLWNLGRRAKIYTTQNTSKKKTIYTTIREAFKNRRIFPAEFRRL